MKKQAVLTESQKKVILIGLTSISETFNVMSLSKENTDNAYFKKVVYELLETYKSFIKQLPAAWRNLNRPEAPGYVATARSSQQNIITLERLYDELVSAEMFPERINEENVAHRLNPLNTLYRVWLNHNWAFKCFLGIKPPAPRIMTEEEYNTKYSLMAEMLYEKLSKG